MFFTDIHSHILPGLDDGASDEFEFLEMAGRALRGGTVRMVATPHYDLENEPIPWEEITQAVDVHRRKLRDMGWELELLPGAEIRINSGLYLLAVEGGDLKTLTLGGNGRYLLVDLPLLDIPVSMDDTLFRIQLCGCTPILAHPERNRRFVERPGRLRDLANRGVEMQLNSGSLLGFYGRGARRTALALLEEGLARLVASDAHRARGRDPDLSGAWQKVRKLLGEKAADILFKENPEAVLAGEDLFPLPLSSKARTRIRSRPGRRGDGP